MKARLKVGMIGAGMVSGHHLAAWRSRTDAAVIAIADPDIVRARARAATFGVKAVYDSAEAMLAAAELDAVDIVAPVDRHANLCRLAAAKGLAIMCQKPLCSTVEQAEELARDIGERVRFMVHENWRFRPAYRRIGALLGSGRYGRVRSVSMKAQSSGLIPRDGITPALQRQPFLAELERLIVFELLVHHLDTLSWLFGPLRVRDATLSRRSPLVRGEDTALISLSGGGANIRIAASFTEPGAPESVTDSLTIHCAGGTISFAGEQLSAGLGHAVEVFPAEEGYVASYAGAINDFVEGLRNSRPFEVEPGTHLQVLHLVDAVYSAAPDWRGPPTI
jgi:predicted dehydrogenase